MGEQRIIEVFSAGCPACHDIIKLVNRIACPSCEVIILNMNNGSIAKRAKDLGIITVPAVVIDGMLVECCDNQGPNAEALRSAGLGKAL